MELEGAKKFVKVRVNASGRRVIGIVVYDALFARFSDFLNSIDTFLVLRQERDVFAVRKEAVSYLEALEEPGASPSIPRRGAFHPVEIELRGQPHPLRGELFFPEGCALGEILDDERRFLSLRDVTFSESVERYPYLAVAKSGIVVLRSPIP